MGSSDQGAAAGQPAVAIDQLLGTEWVHVFERTSDDGAVYLPADADIPLSRRPRERLILESGGVAQWLTPGAADGLESQRATWSEDDGQIVVRGLDGAIILRVVGRAADRLLVRLP